MVLKVIIAKYHTKHNPNSVNTDYDALYAILCYKIYHSRWIL